METNSTIITDLKIFLFSDQLSNSEPKIILRENIVFSNELQIFVNIAIT